MADDQLKNLVLQRAEDDDALTDDAKLVVMAALESDDDLADVLAVGETAVERVASLNARIDDSAAPAGAYLRSISVQGFRGIGARVKVDIPPGPGLTVIAGRNGSGKSSIAEALELALTGVNSRWTDKATVWTRSWRNLHADVPAEVRIGIIEEGSGVTTLGVDWPAGDVPVAEHTIWGPTGRQETGIAERSRLVCRARSVPPPAQLRRAGHHPGGSPGRLLRPAVQAPRTRAADVRDRPARRRGRSTEVMESWQDIDVPDATFACLDLSTSARLYGLGLEVVGQFLRADGVASADSARTVRLCRCGGAVTFRSLTRRRRRRQALPGPRPRQRWTRRSRPCGPRGAWRGARGVCPFSGASGSHSSSFRWWFTAPSHPGRRHLRREPQRLV